MPFNGSGVYDLPNTTVTPALADTTIDNTDFNTLTADLETALTKCYTKTGESSATANLPMGGFKHTGVAASSALTDYARVTEYQNGDHVAADAGGAADVQTLAVAPSIAAYNKYQRFSFVPVADNTGACTLNVSSVGAKDVKLVNGEDPSAGDLDATGISEVIYDGTNFILLNPATVTGQLRPSTKTIAKALTPVDDVAIYPTGSDGGVFIGGTGKAAGYYDDDSVLGYGTRFKPTGGDGTAGWEREDYQALLPHWYLVLADGTTDDTTGWLEVFAKALSSKLEISHRGFSVISSTLEYNTTTLGNYSGLHLIGEGRESSGFINKIVAGGPTIRVTSGAVAADLQFGGEISGLSFTESGSGAASHGVEYRGCWKYKFKGLKCTDLTGAGLQAVNTADDFDSSAFVDIDDFEASDCLLGGYNSGASTGGINQHTLSNYRIWNCGGSDGNVILDGVIHFKAETMGVFGAPLGPKYVATQIGIHIKSTNITAQRIIIERGEMGNSLQKGIVIDQVVGCTLGNFRIVKRPGENTLTTGIEVSDGSTVDNLTINPITIDWNDATPNATIYKIGTSITNDFRIKSPRINAFTSGNIYLSFNAGAEDKGGMIEDRFGNLLFQKTVLRNRQTIAAPGNLDTDMLTGNLQQFLISATGAYTLTAPSNGAVDGGSFKVQIWNISGGAITVTFDAAINGGGYVDPAHTEITSAAYIYDGASSRWRIDGAWSTPAAA